MAKPQLNLKTEIDTENLSRKKTKINEDVECVKSPIGSIQVNLLDPSAGAKNRGMNQSMDLRTPQAMMLNENSADEVR